MEKPHNQRYHEKKYRGKNIRHTPSARPDGDNLVTPSEFDFIPSRRHKHPPHLKGREIGLYYASLNKGKGMKKKDQEYVPQVQVNAEIVSKTEQVLLQSQLPLHENAGLDWKDKYGKLGSSKFKEKFLDILRGNEHSHFAQMNDVKNIEDCLNQDVELDERLSEDLLIKRENPEYQAMLEKRKKLPAYEKRNEIVKAVQENQVIVIKGETGCGKTTQVAQFLLDSYIESKQGSVFHAICTQPRRLAAIAVAQRVAQERCEACGSSLSSAVGYQIRLECRSPRKRGSILYCTTGILLQFLQSDPYLENVSHLLLDEVHERDVLSDFILTVVRDLLPKRPKLRVILMSATINADMFSNYFSNCPSIDIPGLTFPVQEVYLEDILTLLDFRVRPKCAKRFRPLPGSPSHKEDVEYTKFIVPYVEELEAKRSYPCHVTKSLRMRESEESPDELIMELLHHISTQEGPGAILVFLSGWEQISRLHRSLTSDRLFSTSRFLILPLHSMMPTTSQRQVFDRPARGTRKIILSTNIAETSLTIDDIVYVIDTGRTKQSGFDAKKNLSTLQAEWIAQANARQRKGRAGRVQAGVCYRLYTRFRQQSMVAHPIPEMHRMRLEEVILRIKILKLGQVKAFLQHVPEVPDPATVDISLELLRSLGALDSEERLTPLGFHLAQLPVDPCTGKLILMGAIFGCLEPILSIAAALSFKDPFVIPLNKEDLVRKAKKKLSEEQRSDHLLIARVLHDYREARARHWSESKDYCRQNFLSSSTMSMLCDMADQFAKDLYERQFIGSPSVRDSSGNVNSRNRKLIRAILCAGLFPNIASVKRILRKRPTKAGGRPPPPIIQTAQDGKVTLHPKSLNYDETEFESRYLVYHTKVKTTAIFLHDCSEVSPFSLLLFSDQISRRDNKGHQPAVLQVIDINRDIAFLSNQPTAQMIENLRRHLDCLLRYRVSHPGPTDWSLTCPRSAVLRAIVELLTTEGSHSYGFTSGIKPTTIVPRLNEEQIETNDSSDNEEPDHEARYWVEDEGEPRAGCSQLRDPQYVPEKWDDESNSEENASEEADHESIFSD